MGGTDHGSHAVVLELFCGTAGLSASLRQLGFEVIAVDKIVSKSPKVMVTKLDLTQHATQQLVLEWIRLPQVKAVFVAPCGTASKARTIQLKGQDDLPQPLRTTEFPDGVDGLTGWNFLRVEQSNILYDYVSEVYMECCRLGKLFVCENPKDSLFWQVTPWVERDFQELSVEQVHQACAYGSKRPKWTKLVANFSDIEQIDKTCPGDHQHEPWGIQLQGPKRIFATALEVHYPTQLCDALAETIALALQKQGIVPTAQFSLNKGARAFTNLQAGTSKVPTFLPEHKNRIVTIWYNDLQIWPHQLAIPPLSKLLHEIQVGGDDLQLLCKAVNEQCALRKLHVNVHECDVSVDASMFSFPCVVGLKIFGFFWSDIEFFEQALTSKHPLDVALALPCELREAVDYNLKTSAHEVALDRARFLATWAKRAKELAKDERKLKESMDPEVARAVSSKRILLFEEILKSTSFPDMDVVNELKQGAELTGTVDETGMLPGKFIPALSTVEELRANAARIRPKIISEATGSGDSHIDSVVWTKTLEEVEKGWLLGPLQQCEVPDSHPISRRFGLLQKKGKVRLIDDYTESGVNTCVTTVESPVLHTIDVACALLALWFETCEELKLDSTVVARTFDLTSAYRQVALSSEGKQFSCIRVFDPNTGSMQLFRSLVLPFGAIRSVHAFLRLARAIWWIGVVGCRILWTSFYDDYIAFSSPALIKCTETTIISLFKLLGWAFAEEGDKCSPFDNLCEALGVMFDLHNSCRGSVFVKNTESRVLELCNDLQEIITGGVLSSKQAQRLRGRMQFAEAQMFGRTGRRCLRVLGEFAEGRRQKLQTKDIFFLRLFKELLQSNVPREIKSLCKENVIIFTDACYERTDRIWPCGLGGVLCLNGTFEFFSVPVDCNGRNALGEASKKQIIFEAETLAAVLAFALWKERFSNRRCVIFVDNEGTKFSLLKGSSDNSTVDLLAGLFAELESSIHSFTWLARVPSKSNIADPPSRNDVSAELFQRAKNVSADASSLLNGIVTRITENGVTELVTRHSRKRVNCS